MEPVNILPVDQLFSPSRKRRNPQNFSLAFTPDFFLGKWKLII